MEEEPTEQPKVSKYNSAIAQLYRLDELWKDAHKHSRNGMLMRWNADLDRVWCELGADADEKKTAEFKDINLELRKIGINVPTTNPIKLGERYTFLLEKEMFLRKLLNEQGKGTAWADEDEDLM